VTAITTITRDPITGYRAGRCGDWYVRARRGGGSFDLALPPFEGWDEVSAEFIGLTLDQASRLLGMPRGELYDWGRSE
jgi:hypothetical protein